MESQDTPRDIVFDALDRARRMCFGIIVSETVTFPLLPISAVKTTLQTSTMTIPQTARYVYNTHGWMGFFRAFPATIAYHMASASTKYTFYHVAKRIRRTDDTDFFSNRVKGVIGGVCGSVFTHPVDVIKNLKQRNENVRAIVRDNGAFTLYRGFPTAVARTFMSYGLLYPTYDLYKNRLKGTRAESFVAPLAIFTSTVAMQPLDYIKTRMIAKMPFNHGWNVPAYYRGMTLQLLRVVPRFWITMSVAGV